MADQEPIDQSASANAQASAGADARANGQEQAGGAETADTGAVSGDDPGAGPGAEPQSEAEVNTRDEAQPIALQDFAQSHGQVDPSSGGINLLNDVSLTVKIELGRTKMYVDDVLRLNEHSVVELDKAAGDPVDIYVNERHVARGEVLVVNDNFCVRISEIVEQMPREEEMAVN